MEVFRRLATEAPELRAFRDDKPTLLVSWWCTFFSITVILTRVCGRYIRAERFFPEDGIMMASIIPLLIRMGLAHVVLLFGTNNIVTTGLSESTIKRHEIGSKAVLAARVFYAAYLWTIKLSSTTFLYTLISSVRRHNQHDLMRYFYIFLGLTFFGTLMADLTECTPFTHYWQVVPDPGPKCRQGYAFLFSNGVLHMVTNLVLVILPLPIIARSKLTWKQKTSIIIRLSLPILSIAYTSYALYKLSVPRTTQQHRTLYASLDILLSTFIANVLVLLSLWQDRGFKKSKFQLPSEINGMNKFGSFAGDAKRRGSRRVSSKAGLADDEIYLRKRQEEGIELNDVGGLMRKPMEKARFREWERDGERGGENGRNTPGPPGMGDIRVAQSWLVEVEEDKV
ncbi:hypothetical protein BGZ60DRAFT_392142 [Tricladium varicosporioides]|nr:hypothetical protein BGZ60DRAFT_392142 [Hymenoscyphus varicosporioides]